MEYFWIKKDRFPWEQVSEGEWICAEKSAGFRLKTGSGRATAGFSSEGYGRLSVRGAITTTPEPPTRRRRVVE